MTDRERILDRLRKLCALESSSNRHEATVARELADRLCALHGVTRAEAASSEGDGTYELPLGAHGWNETWRFALVTAAARYYGADAVSLIVGERHKVRLVGVRADVEAARDLYDRLTKVVREIELALSQSEVMGYFLDMADAYGAKESSDAFRQGVVAGIALRLASGYDVDSAPAETSSPPAGGASSPGPESSPSTALMVRTAMERSSRSQDRASRARKKYAPKRSERRLDDVLVTELFALGRDLALSAVRVSPGGEVKVSTSRGGSRT